MTSPVPTRSRRPNDSAVLTGVKVKPSGWPAASLDTGSGRPGAAPGRNRANGKINETRSA
jgi:hypothetical protein